MSVVPAVRCRRNSAMDTARGIAVIGMIILHLVPLDGLGTAVSELMAGTFAALFFILAGMSWAIQADRVGSIQGSYRWVMRRSLALLVLGLLLHGFVWSTEVLTPFAIMQAPVLWIRSKGRRAMVVAIFALLAAVLVGAVAFAGYAQTDWKADGSHYADSTFGWVTLRYLLIDGNYPVIPWLAFPLLGLLFVRGGEVLQGRMRLWLGVGSTLGASLWLLTNWTADHADRLGEAAKYVSTTWVPTTVPFMLLKGSVAVAVIAGLAVWHQGTVLPRVCHVVACVGRASLTHYLAHICLVFAPLRLFYPGEDWPLSVGLAASLLYCAVAIPLSALWFRSHKRGPLEQLLAWISGGLPRHAPPPGAPSKLQSDNSHGEG